MTAVPAEGGDTFPKLIQRNARLRPSRPAFRHKDFGIWQEWSWAEVHETVRAFAVGLAMLGVERGTKVAVVGRNRPRLYWSSKAMTSSVRRCKFGITRLAISKKATALAVRRSMLMTLVLSQTVWAFRST